MKEISSTDLARRLKQVLDEVIYRDEEFVIVRNKQRIARLLPGVEQKTALEAMSDLYRTLPEDAATTWLKESRMPEKLDPLKNPWDS